MKKAIKAAFPLTLPVFAGYIFLGIAFGFLMVSNDYPLAFPIIMSIFIYSGALEFAAIPVMNSAFDPIGMLLLGLLLSARHVFYGIVMLNKYDGAGKAKLPLIFTLTDETFSILSTIKPPEQINKYYFYLAVSLFNFIYWNLGTVIGAVFGKIISFDSTGIDFALTALFIVLFLEHIKTKTGLKSGIIGLLITIFALGVFGSEKMVIVSMIGILIALMLGEKFILNE